MNKGLSITFATFLFFLVESRSAPVIAYLSGTNTEWLQARLSGESSAANPQVFKSDKDESVAFDSADPQQLSSTENMKIRWLLDQGIWYDFWGRSQKPPTRKGCTTMNVIKVIKFVIFGLKQLCHHAIPNKELDKDQQGADETSILTRSSRNTVPRAFQSAPGVHHGNNTENVRQRKIIGARSSLEKSLANSTTRPFDSRTHLTIQETPYTHKRQLWTHKTRNKSGKMEKTKPHFSDH